MSFRPSSSVAGCLAVSALLVGSSGCATRNAAPETRRVVAVDHATWVGHSLDAVIAKFGEWDSAEPDGNGGRILRYIQRRNIQGSDEDPSRWPGDMPGDRDVGTDARVGVVTHDDRVAAIFWVDEAGRIYRYWFEPRVFKRGFPLPPAPRERDGS